MNNKNMLTHFSFLKESEYVKLLDIFSSFEDKVSKTLYLDSQSGLVYPKSYGGFFVDMFNLILRTEWLSNDQQHELINHIMNQGGDFGSFSYFVKILSIILETNDIHIEPNLGDLRIIATGSSSTLLGNIITYEKGLKMIEWQDKYIVAQVESAIFGDAEAGGFLFYFLSNFLVLGDFATITLKAGESYAQNYFASSTRKFELIIDRINDLERIDSREKLKEAENQLSGVLFDHGVDSKGISIIRSKGDEAFFNGRNTGSMKEQYGIKKSKPLADFTNITINLAKALASSITSTTVKRDSIFGKEKIEKEHIKSNKQSRKALVDSGIYPEDIPPEEDIKKIASKIKKEEKALIKKNKKRR